MKKVSSSVFRVTSITSNSKLVSGSRTVDNKLTYTYNSGETVITDNFGNKNYIVFDNAGRTVNVRDNHGNASFAEYNNSGNTKNTLRVSSDTFASIDNLAKNNSGELADDLWYQQISPMASGSATIATNEHQTGAKSFKVTSTASTGVVNFCQALNITPNKSYTLSAYVKINTQLVGEGGATLGCCYKDTSGAWHTIKSEFITEVQDWHRENFTFALPNDATGSIGIMLIVDNSVGTVYFDSVQLEEGSSMNRYNLLTNGNFEYTDTSNSPIYWSKSNGESNDGIAAGINGYKGYRIYGNPEKEKSIYQDVTVNGKVGDTIVIGGWVLANAADQQTDSTLRNFFRVTATINYTDSTKAYFSADFNRDVHTSQYVCNSFTATKDYSTVRYYFTYYKDVNNAVFDSACMYIDTFGSKYSYNSDGRLVSTTDGTGQGMSYTYDGPDLTKVSQKFDGEEKESCTYTYDDKHNLLTETTKGGVVTAYEYGAKVVNTYGMPTKTTVQTASRAYETVSRKTA